MKNSLTIHTLRWILSIIMIAAGTAHFRTPMPFASIVPNYLPYHIALVMISGFFEIAGGMSLLIRRTRRLASWGLIALYLAVFPANINMAVHRIPIDGHHYSQWILWGRLPLQAVLIIWAWYCGKD